jgi:hypothetical protein
VVGPANHARPHASPAAGRGQPPRPSRRPSGGAASNAPPACIRRAGRYLRCP